MHEVPCMQYVRVELSSEANLWFLYIHELDQEGFHELQDQQRLMLNFAEYPALLTKMLTSCIRDPRQFLGILSMQPQVRGRLMRRTSRGQRGCSAAERLGDPAVDLRRKGGGADTVGGPQVRDVCHLFFLAASRSLGLPPSAGLQVHGAPHR